MGATDILDDPSVTDPFMAGLGAVTSGLSGGPSSARSGSGPSSADVYAAINGPFTVGGADQTGLGATLLKFAPWAAVLGVAWLAMRR